MPMVMVIANGLHFFRSLAVSGLVEPGEVRSMILVNYSDETATP